MSDSLPMFDIAVLVVVLLSAVLAMLRGFTHQALSIAAWIAAIAAVVFGLPVLRPYFRAMISNTLAADGAAAAVLFIGTMIVASLIVRAISSGVRGSVLSPVDRALGFVFGLVRGGLLVVLAYIVMAWMLDLSGPPSWMKGAKTTPWIVGAADTLIGWAPDSLTGSDAAHKANAAKRTAEDAIAIDRTVKSWGAPAPKAPAGGETPQGYGEDQRREMNRLIDANR
ncbi:putative Protein, required for colicin V production [uncultured Alphaproteobacteria bacterium]|uniref:Colicin V production protein n=1 Tax=uncultured Alphaproteobacteria bacterium TaxID=91750 RepID=A0A212KLD6_9PROT|nr:putative Protein, required for colicin V production [uncultured Alphaproteobacteria bacterium]